MLLSRVADHIYWGARYMERADGTARVVRTFTEVLLDLPVGVASSWEPLLAVAGGRELFDEGHARANESDVVRFLVALGIGAVVVGVVLAICRESRTAEESAEYVLQELEREIAAVCRDMTVKLAEGVPVQGRRVTTDLRTRASARQEA